MKRLNLQLALLLLTATLVGCWGASSAAAAIVYQTSFEPSEGYKTNLDLVGQNGWVGAGSGGNGIVTGFFPGKGQQAYVGFLPPLTNDSSLFVYHRLNQNLQKVQFSVTMAIIDSTTTNRDDFYWSVFNQQGQQLFTLDFDNFELNLYYYLDNTNGRTFSGLSFTNDIAYPLTITMDYASNRWSATFGGALVATNQPITTSRAALNLGDIDAAWAIFDPNVPGDNFMVFDDYQVIADVPQPQLLAMGISNGLPALHLSGLANTHFALESSSNLLNWLPLTTNTSSGGSFDYVDASAAGLPARFYRARWVP